MIPLAAYAKPDEWSSSDTEYYYQTDYKRWNGLVCENPVLRQIIEVRAASVFSSWLVRGSHEKAATDMLAGMVGRSGHDSFKQIMANLYRIAYICGDAYAEKIYEDDDPEKGIIDLHILPSDNIQQVIKKGKIIKFRETSSYTGSPAEWEPFRILHIRYNPRGAMTHGIGMVEALNNLLITRTQLMQVMSNTYERMSQPKMFLLANTDNSVKLGQIRDAVKAAGDSWDGIAVLPGNLIQKTEPLVLSPSLKPQEALDYLDKDLFKATATPEIVLGTGYSTSEEDAKTRIAGFMGSIRYDQENFEEDIRTQIFVEMWPTSPPEIEFSFTDEAFDAMFNRELSAIPIIDGSPTIAPENKDALIRDRLKRAGMLT